MDETHPLDALYATIAARKDADPGESYTAQLLSQGKLKIAKKLGEEAVETALAAVADSREALVGESADLLYHLLVLWAAAGVAPGDVYAALEARTARSGLAEKASRKTR